MPVISFMQESKQIDDFTASILAGNFFTCCLFRYMKLFLNGCPQCRRDYKTDLQKILVIGVTEYKYHISKDQNNVITLFSSFSFLPMALTLRGQLHDLCSKGQSPASLSFLHFSLRILYYYTLALNISLFCLLFSYEQLASTYPASTLFKSEYQNISLMCGCVYQKKWPSP